MRDECILEFQSGKIVTATMALVKLVKLHQILTGFVVDDEGSVEILPNNRIQALLQIAETTQPLVVFCAYRENVIQVTKALEQAFGDKSVVTYYGNTSREDRTRAVKRFQEGDAQFFIGTSAAAKGLTLHRASSLVYFSNTYSLETRMQSQDRIHRIGQNKKCTYTDLVVPGSLDHKILQKLKDKQDLSNLVLEDLGKLFS